MGVQSTNRFQGTVARVTLKLVFLEGDRPRANEAYQIVGAGEPNRGTTSAEGALSIVVPADASSVCVVFEEDRVTFQVDIGHVDPATESSGVRERLRQLGYLRLDPGGEATDEAALLYATTRFQREHGFECTGEWDEATREALVKEFGS